MGMRRFGMRPGERRWAQGAGEGVKGGTGEKGVTSVKGEKGIRCEGGGLFRVSILGFPACLRGASMSNKPNRRRRPERSRTDLAGRVGRDFKWTIRGNARSRCTPPRQTKPICGVLGLKMGIAMENKANFHGPETGGNGRMRCTQVRQTKPIFRRGREIRSTKWTRLKMRLPGAGKGAKGAKGVKGVKGGLGFFRISIFGIRACPAGGRRPMLAMLEGGVFATWVVVRRIL
jgi:hypothetical protein